MVNIKHKPEAIAETDFNFTVFDHLKLRKRVTVEIGINLLHVKYGHVLPYNRVRCDASHATGEIVLHFHDIAAYNELWPLAIHLQRERRSLSVDVFTRIIH